MTPEEYAAQQLLISSSIASFVQQFGKFFAQPGLSVKDWLSLLGLLFPEVQRQRDASAALARTFYDSQRAQAHPNLPRNDRLLEGFQFEDFVADMEPVRIKVSQEDTPQHAIDGLALRVMRSVENGGRRQIINAVKNDEPLAQHLDPDHEPSKDQIPDEFADQLTPEARRVLGLEPNPVQSVKTIHDIRGWARVATGRETCAWCLMLISRGPTYLGADTAGLDLDETSALAAFRDASDMETFFADISDYMEEWHVGCDCKVVPVFKSEHWFGEAEAKRALVLWNDATKTAKLLHKLGPTKRSGKNKGKDLTLNEVVINVLRDRLNSGEISTSEFAALTAA